MRKEALVPFAFFNIERKKAVKAVCNAEKL